MMMEPTEQGADAGGPVNGRPELDRARQKRAQQYASIRRRLLAIELVAGAVYLSLWLGLGWAQLVLDRFLAGALTNSAWAIQLLVVAAAVALPWILLTLPLAYYQGFHLPHRFELSTQAISGWLADQAKSGLIAVVLGTPLLIGFYQLIRWSPSWWWLWSAIGLTLVTTVLAALAPALLMPIFFKIEPLPGEWDDLKQRLIGMAETAGTKIASVNRMDMSRRTRAANAALAGLGRTRQILLGDTLLDSFSPDEIETILAHELGHQVHGDIPKSIAFESGLNLITLFLLQRVVTATADGLGLTGAADPAGLPLIGLALAAFGLLSMPISNAFSRWRERMADRFALEITGAPAAFASAMTRLANQNLAQVDPEPWTVLLFASHPPLKERIATAQAYEPRQK